MSEPAKRVRKRREKPTPAEAVSRGVAAQRDLTLLEQAFAIYSEELFGAWLETPAADVAKREEIHATVRAVAGARSVLIRIINEAHVAEAGLAFEQMNRAN